MRPPLRALPDMPAPQSFDREGMRIVYFEAGSARPDRPSLVLCQGFPDMAYGWLRQIADFARMGFHVLAPDQRGYGQTDCPTEIEAYDLESLTGDLAELLDRKGLQRAVFVGHDWGGLVVWRMAIAHPKRVAGVVALNTPYTKRAPSDPVALYRRRFGESFYIVRFNEDDAADRAFAADPARTMRFFFRRPAGVDPASAMDPRAGLDTIAALAAYDPEKDDRQFLSPGELETYAAAFGRTGFTPAINWYRNFTRNWERAPEVADLVTQPSLMILAGRDEALPPSAADGMEKYVPDLERRIIPASGHWTQQEFPEEVSAIVGDWLARRFAGAPGLAGGGGGP
jgi:pimeloyl-ACP methyl ester carboxylesterase